MPGWRGRAGRSARRLLYNLLFPAFLVLSLPHYGWRMLRRGGWRRGFGERLGILPRQARERLRQGGKAVWFHAVSVGEAKIVARLVRDLESDLAGWTVVASATTTTGMGELERLLPEGVLRIYYPVDLAPAVSAVLAQVRPRLVVLAEAEIWPNLLWKLADRSVPVFLANARISPRSAARYRMARFFFAEHFASLAGIGLQSPCDAAALRDLGCRPQALKVTGNLKFDASLDGAEAESDHSGLLRWAGAGEGDPVLLGSSTHRGEERMLGEIFLRLRRRHPRLFLVMVPRHFERGAAVGRELKRLGIRPRLRSEHPREPSSEGDCLVVDSTGELRFLYPLADLVVIGKSFLARGGQSPVEAAAAGSAIVAGPHMENFQGILRCLEGCLVRVPDERALERELRSLLDDVPRRRRLGLRARQEVELHRGAVERTLTMLRPLLDPEG